MTEWEKMNIIKKCQRAVEGINLKSPFETRCAVVDVQEALDDFAEEVCTDVVEIVRDGDFLIRFADGVEYAILEGVVPGRFEVNHHEPTSDLMFVMDNTTSNWKLVDWVAGVNLMTMEEIVEFCKDLRKKGAD